MWVRGVCLTVQAGGRSSGDLITQNLDCDGDVNLLHQIQQSELHTHIVPVLTSFFGSCSKVMYDVTIGGAKLDKKYR